MSYFNNSLFSTIPGEILIMILNQLPEIAILHWIKAYPNQQKGITDHKQLLTKIVAADPSKAFNLPYKANYSYLVAVLTPYSHILNKRNLPRTLVQQPFFVMMNRLKLRVLPKGQFDRMHELMRHYQFSNFVERAISHDGSLFDYLPAHLKKKRSLQVAALSSARTSRDQLSQLKSIELWVGLLRKHLGYLKLLHPDLQKNKELAGIAINRSGNALQYFPPLKRDLKTCLKAVRRTPFALKYVEHPLRNHSILIAEALKRNGRSIVHAAPSIKKSLHYAKMAVSQNGMALRYLFKFHKNNVVVKLATIQNPHAIQFATPTLKNNPDFAFEMGVLCPSSLCYFEPPIRLKAVQFVEDLIRAGRVSYSDEPFKISANHRPPLSADDMAHLIPKHPRGSIGQPQDAIRNLPKYRARLPHHF